MATKRGEAPTNPISDKGMLVYICSGGSTSTAIRQSVAVEEVAAEAGRSGRKEMRL